jgi:hypothetical protein
MRRLAILAMVVVSVVLAVAASGWFLRGYSFGDWARDNGYSPGDAMPNVVSACLRSIKSLDGIDDFDWTATWSLDLRSNQISRIESGAFSGLTNLTELVLNGNRLSSIELGAFSGLANLTTLALNHNQLSNIEAGVFNKLTNLEQLYLDDNQISSIEPGDFDGLPYLKVLGLNHNQISSIEPGDFSGLANLRRLDLNSNVLLSIESGALSGLTNLTKLNLTQNIALTELNLAGANFSSLTFFNVYRNYSVRSVSLANTVVNQKSLATLLDGGVLNPLNHSTPGKFFGIGELDVIDGITKMDLSGVDFADVTDLEPLHVMDDLTDLWLVDTKNLDAAALDVLLDNLETIEGTEKEGVLHMTQADFDAFDTAGDGLLAAWDAEPGHHVEIVK